jgi:hypothetical protein
MLSTFNLSCIFVESCEHISCRKLRYLSLPTVFIFTPIIENLSNEFRFDIGPAQFKIYTKRRLKLIAFPKKINVCIVGYDVR